MRCSCGGTFLPPRKRGSASATRRVPAPARGEHRRVEQRLHEHVAHGRRVQVARDLVEREAVAGRQRQDDRVLGRRRLQLEVELAAEALAQREPPRAVDAAAERRVDDELHAARLVEEALEHDRLLRRQRAERGARRGEVLDDLLAPPRRRARPLRRASAIAAARSRVEPRVDARRAAATPPCDSSSLRAGASPSQNGMRRRLRRARPRRARGPRSTRRIRYDVLPSWKMSPARLSIAKSSLTVPTSVPCGLEHDVVVGGVGNRAARGERGQRARRAGRAARR